IFAEEVLANVGSVLRDVCLEFAVYHFAHALLEQAGGVAAEQLIPIATPDHLDHIPAGAAEGRFQFLDHLAVATNRTIEALQFAVDYEDQIVEPLPRGESQGTHRFGLIHFAIAQIRPDLTRSDWNQTAILEVAHEARLVDRVDRAKT